ncbi:antirestriction protein [Asticcacaulis sp. W401b]|uniref:antirestriction protein n=1 Tax=Asticcacaulis sp. W401b TaxID=3388666 RepID=UPI00397086ED
MTDTLTTNSPTVTKIPDEERGEFIPKMLPGVPLIFAENYVFDIMSNLCREYGGGFWDYFRGSNGALYMVPTGYDRMRLVAEGNGFDDEMSADAAGIVATLFALSHLSFRYQSDRLSEMYGRLLEFAYAHPESALICRAID